MDDGGEKRFTHTPTMARETVIFSFFLAENGGEKTNKHLRFRTEDTRISLACTAHIESTNDESVIKYLNKMVGERTAVRKSFTL